MIYFLVILSAIFSHNYGASQTPNEMVVVGALVYDCEGVEFGASGNLEMARRKFERALHYMPYHARSILNLQICKDAEAGNISAKVAITLFTSLDHLYSADSLAALNSANVALLEKPNYTPGYLCRARIYERLSSFDEVLADYDGAVELSPMFPLNYYFRGKFHEGLERYDQAIADFTRLIEIDSSYAPAFLERGNSYCSINEFDAAIEDYEIALRAWPRWRTNFKIFAAYLNRGIAHLEKNRYQEALLDLNEAIALNKMFGEPYLHRGIAHWNLKSLDKAIPDFSVAIDKDPEAAEAYYYRGLCWQKEGDAEPAVEDYLKAIALAPDHLPTHHRLAEVYLNQKRFALALEEFDRILELDPNRYWAYYWKALINDKLENYPVAINFYNCFLEKASQQDMKHRIFANERIKQLTRWTAK